MTDTSRPSIFPTPVTQPSAGVRRPSDCGVLIASANKPYSTKVPASKSTIEPFPHRQLAGGMLPVDKIGTAHAERVGTSLLQARCLFLQRQGLPRLVRRRHTADTTGRSSALIGRGWLGRGPVHGAGTRATQPGIVVGYPYLSGMPATALAHPVGAAHQGTFDELGQPLYDVTFVVVDLETTGGSPADSSITEVGAVKVRGGEVLGEFATLVNPGRAIPPMITVLTGITDAMVLVAPPISEVLPAFLEFARGSVLVAHNAPFDVGFLRAACTLGGYVWPGFETVDTARLARQVLTRDEAADCRLATLARLFRTSTMPCHRALDDARATVDVLHRLIERLAGFGVTSLEELRLFSARVTPAQRRKRHLADPMPTAPGVYLFRDGRRHVLYVGKSRNLRSRVRSYFTASEHRSRMAEMVAVTETVEAIECPTLIEAEVRELRLIAEHRPRYNRRSRFPERAVYLKLTVEPFPRLSQVRRIRNDGAQYLGPFASTTQAELAAAAIHEAFPLRQCAGSPVPAHAAPRLHPARARQVRRAVRGPREPS